MSAKTAVLSNPRDRAHLILLTCYEGFPLCSEMMEELQAKSPLGPQDAGLTAELVIGVSRWRITTEHIAGRYYEGRWAGLRPTVRVILSMGVYQLCWLDRVPDHAAVNEAVRQARRYGAGPAAIVNAVLRKVTQARGEFVARTGEVDPRRFLGIDEQRGRMFEDAVFPDPARRPLEYLIATTSHPAFLVERWHRRFKPMLCRQICEAGQRRGVLTLRANRMRISAEELSARMKAAGRDATIAEETEAVIVRGGVRAADVIEIEEGLCQPQDATAQGALLLSAPGAGEFVLDLCAGSGTKSTQAAELMGDRGIVIASDVNEARLGRIEESARRLGLAIVEAVGADDLRDRLERLGRAPDLILVDAPCTNTGVLGRRPEARYRATAKALGELVEIQRGILARAAEMAGSRTRIIYSTCSIEREENEGQAAAFCAARPGWRVQRERFVTPGAERDGGYAALLARGRGW